MLHMRCCHNFLATNFGIKYKYVFRKEMAYFNKMTKLTLDNNKKNAVIMGRITWDSIPSKFKPLDGRLNVVVTRDPDRLRVLVPEGVMVSSSLDQAIQQLQNNHNSLEHIWVIGGHSLYKEAMDHSVCHRVYLTQINKSYDCDVFFPKIPTDFKLLQDHGDEAQHVPMEVQEEDGVEYFYRIYEKTQ